MLEKNKRAIQVALLAESVKAGKVTKEAQFFNKILNQKDQAKKEAWSQVFLKMKGDLCKRLERQ